MRCHPFPSVEATDWPPERQPSPFSVDKTGSGLGLGTLLCKEGGQLLPPLVGDPRWALSQSPVVPLLPFARDWVRDEHVTQFWPRDLKGGGDCGRGGPFQ